MASSGEERNFENWMSEIPECLQSQTLTKLSIPGSHKCYTYSLKAFGDVDGQAPVCAQCLALFCGCMGRGRVYGWSQTQNKEIYDQLAMGIRYFDLQVIFRRICSDFYCVNGLYAARVSEVLDDIMLYLKTHRKEIVILDINQFTNFSSEDFHKRFYTLLTDIIGPFMIPQMDWNKLTLKELWDMGKQVMVIYSDNAASSADFSNLWPNSSIDRQTMLTTSTNRLVHHLETRFQLHKPKDIFTVWPGYLTPTSATIAGRLCGNLQDDLAPKAAGAYVNWLKEKHGLETPKINICCMDFIEMKDFVSNVLSLNKLPNE